MLRSKTSAQDQVAEFMQMMGYTNTSWTYQVSLLRASLVAEEAAEYIAAAQQKSRVGMADALTDLKYVILGAGVSMKIPMPDDFDVPVERKWKDIEEAELLSSTRRVYNVMSSLVNALLTTEHIASALRLADSTCAIEAARLGFPLRELFNEVHRSNMTKTPANGVTKYSDTGKGTAYQAPDLERVLSHWQRTGQA
jgi:predicted HAD superfamily Cof-like phosphohydrolase